MRASSSWASQIPLFPQQVRGARLVGVREALARVQGFFLSLLRFARRCAFAFLAGRSFNSGRSVGGRWLAGVAVCGGVGVPALSAGRTFWLSDSAMVMSP